VSATIPSDLVNRFQEAAKKAGVDSTAALEQALAEWIERH